MSVAAVVDDRYRTDRPYGVWVGDRVYYWPEITPPLSSNWVAPECLPALVLRVTGDDQSGWFADLAVVEPDGQGGATVRLRSHVLQSESGAYINSNPQRHYGTSPGGSWHRELLHDSEAV